MLESKTISILGTHFEVKVEPLGSELCGETTAHKRLIRVDSGLPYGAQVETFYHELVHAMMAHLGLDALFTQEQNEALAQGLGMALTYVVSINELPALNAGGGDENE